MAIDTTLPRASILEKFMQTDPAAGDWIMDRTEEIQRLHHQAQIRALKRFNPQAFFQGVSSAFGGSGLQEKFLSQAAPSSNNIEEGFEKVGDYMRAAIHDYCRTHDIDLMAIELTLEETLSLHMKNPDNLTELSFPAHP